MSLQSAEAQQDNNGKCQRSHINLRPIFPQNMSTNMIFHTKTQYELMNLDKKSGQKEPVTSIAKKMFTGH